MQIKQEFHNGRTVWTVELRHWRTHGQEWIGKVTGTDEKYGLKLEFCDVIRRNWSRSGKNGKGSGTLKYTVEQLHSLMSAMCTKRYKEQKLGAKSLYNPSARRGHDRTTSRKEVLRYGIETVTAVPLVALL